MANARKDVCAEVTCLHASGLRKVAVVALGCTAAAAREKHNGQGMASGGVGNIIKNFRGSFGQFCEMYYAPHFMFLLFHYNYL